MGAEIAKAERTDRILIKTHEPGVIKAWAKQLGVSEARIRYAIEKVGPVVADVVRFIRN